MKTLSQNKTMKRLLVLFFVTLAAPHASLANGGAKDSKRWTLQQWLEQRDRNRMMDLWLSMNSPSPFEFMASGSLWNYTSTSTGGTEQKYDAYQGSIAGNAQFIGLYLDHQNNSKEAISDLTGQLRIRLLGDSFQNSSLTVGIGQRTRNFLTNGSANILRSPTSDILMQIYLSQHFGISGSYRNFEPTPNEALGATVGGNETKAGIYIDFNSVRIFGNLYTENEFQKTSSAETNKVRTGIQSGFMIFY